MNVGIFQWGESADVEKSADADPSTVVRINDRGIKNRINNDRCVPGAHYQFGFLEMSTFVDVDVYPSPI